MNEFIIRTVAYHGEPVVVGGLPTRAGYSHDEPIAKERVVNDPGNDTVRDAANDNQQTAYDILALIEDFEDEYGCKVSDVELAPTPDGGQVFEFDIFEPTWADEDEAKDVIDDLTERVVDWVEGYPAGR